MTSLSAIAALPAQEGAKVEAVELNVRRKPTIDGVQTFGEPGLELKLAVLVPGKPILEVDADSSRLVRFVDDKGTDLAAGAPKGFFSWVSLDTAFREEPIESAMLQIKTGTLPADGAGRVELEAVIALRSAEGEQKKQARVALQKGQAIEHGPVPMKVSNVSEGGFGGGALKVDISSEVPLTAVKAFEFLDAAGVVLEVSDNGKSSMSMGDRTTYTRSFGLPEKVDAVTLRIVSYEKVETVELPVSIAFGPGL